MGLHVFQDLLRNFPHPLEDLVDGLVQLELGALLPDCLDNLDLGV